MKFLIENAELMLLPNPVQNQHHQKSVRFSPDNWNLNKQQQEAIKNSDDNEKQTISNTKSRSGNKQKESTSKMKAHYRYSKQQRLDLEKTLDELIGTTTNDAGDNDLLTDHLIMIDYYCDDDWELRKFRSNRARELLFSSLILLLVYLLFGASIYAKQEEKSLISGLFSSYQLITTSQFPGAADSTNNINRHHHQQQRGQKTTTPSKLVDGTPASSQQLNSNGGANKDVDTEQGTKNKNNNNHDDNSKWTTTTESNQWFTSNQDGPAMAVWPNDRGASLWFTLFECLYLWFGLNLLAAFLANGRLHLDSWRRSRLLRNIVAGGLLIGETNERQATGDSDDASCVFYDDYDDDNNDYDHMDPNQHPYHDSKCNGTVLPSLEGILQGPGRLVNLGESSKAIDHQRPSTTSFTQARDDALKSSSSMSKLSNNDNIDLDDLHKPLMQQQHPNQTRYLTMNETTSMLHDNQSTQVSSPHSSLVSFQNNNNNNQNKQHNLLQAAPNSYNMAELYVVENHPLMINQSAHLHHHPLLSKNHVDARSQIIDQLTYQPAASEHSVTVSSATDQSVCIHPPNNNSNSAQIQSGPGSSSMATVTTGTLNHSNGVGTTNNHFISPVGVSTCRLIGSPMQTAHGIILTDANYEQDDFPSSHIHHHAHHHDVTNNNKRAQMVSSSSSNSLSRIPFAIQGHLGVTTIDHGAEDGSGGGITSQAGCVIHTLDRKRIGSFHGNQGGKQATTRRK